MTTCTFIADEQAIQLAYFERNLAGRTGHRGRPFQLLPEHRFDGLLPGVRETAQSLFEPGCLDIQWHPYIGHGRSSQACCINFLMPLASRPRLLARWVSHVLDVSPPEMLPIEKEAAGAHRYVAFEYTGPGERDYLGEAEGKVPRRGAHATASDAAIGFVDTNGKRQLVLIEWKYSEEYRSHRLSPDAAGKRQRRYGDKLLAPSGPVRADLELSLGDFLHEPFYQLARQQMLAWQVERSADSGFDEVRVLHLSPRGNGALHHVTSPAIAAALLQVDQLQVHDVFDAYRACLVDPSRFVSRFIEPAFASLADEPLATWYPALRDRYPSLCPAR